MTVTIEKEVWESTLRQSMEMTAKAERLEKQLEIAGNNMTSAKLIRYFIN